MSLQKSTGMLEEPSRLQQVFVQRVKGGWVGREASSLTGVDTKMWALLGSQGAKSDSVSIKLFDTGTTCHVQAFSNDLILASYII